MNLCNLRATSNWNGTHDITKNTLIDTIKNIINGNIPTQEFWNALEHVKAIKEHSFYQIISPVRNIEIIIFYVYSY